MYGFYFETNGKDEFIKEFENKEDAFGYIEEFINNKLNFKSYYTRVNMISGYEFIIDYGSYVDFIKIKKIDEGGNSNS